MAEQELASIKKPGEIEHVSKEEFEWRIKEIAKCKRDICYFAEKYFKIINLDKGLMTIKLYPKQRELLDFFVNNKRCITLASRQSSKTTTYTIYLLWLTQFFAEKKVMLLANKADTSLEILGRIRLAYEYLPSFLKSAVTIWNKGEVAFSNMSTIKGFATASDSARGFSANCVVADEFSFVPNNIASKVFESIFPVISSSKNSQFIIVSTPNGADPNNLYYTLWQKAISKSADNSEGWKAFRFDWWDVPGRDEQWKKNTIAAIGERRFSQEFGNEFISSNDTKKLIPDDIIEKHRIKMSEMKVSHKEQFTGKQMHIMSEDGKQAYEFTMWHEFDKQRTYAASADTAEGVGGDDSVLYIWDVTDLSNITMCAMFASNMVSLVQFAYIVKSILNLYGDPMLIAERNGVSSGMLDSLHITYGYDNIVTEGKGGEFGVYCHPTVKLKACLWCRDMMTTDGFGWTFYDKNLIEQMSTFVKKESKSALAGYAAVKPLHDDRVMTLVWLCWMLHVDLVEKYFIVVNTFTSSLGERYPKLLQPLQEYTEEQIHSIENNKVHIDFLEFKNDTLVKLHEALESEKQENQNDIFKYKKQYNPYFGDDDGDEWGNSVWSNGSSQISRDRMTQLENNYIGAQDIMPSFYCF